MKKYILLLFTVVLLSSCAETVNKDPQLRTSEIIAVAEVIKTDTLTTVVQLDEKYYVIKDKKVIGRFNKNNDSAALADFLFFILVIIFIVSVLIRD